MSRELVPNFLVVSQPIRMCIAVSTVHNSGLMQRDISCRFAHSKFRKATCFQISCKG